MFNSNPNEIPAEIKDLTPGKSILRLSRDEEVLFLGAEYREEKGEWTAFGTTLNDPERGRQVGEEDDRWFYISQIRKVVSK